jgi:hypothetical protein
MEWIMLALLLILVVVTTYLVLLAFSDGEPGG